LKAARIVEPNKPLELSVLENPRPKGNEVIIKVKAVGVCHSDLHLWEGGYDLGDGTFLKVTDRGVKYPVTPGHEIAGEVAEIGDSVHGISIGEPVFSLSLVGMWAMPCLQSWK